MKKNFSFKTKKVMANLAIKKYHSANQWFWSGLIRYPLFMLFSMFFMLLTAFISILPSILLGLAIDFLKIDGNKSAFIIIIVSMIGAAILNWGIIFTSAYLWGLASYRYERDIRQEFYEVIQSHSMTFHDEHDSGVLLSMGMNETNQMRMAYQPSLRQLLNSLLSIILTCLYFFIRFKIGSKSIGIGMWQIGLGISAGVIIYLVLAWQYARKVGPVRMGLAEELANVSSISQETFRGMEVVRSFDNEKTEEDKFSSQNWHLAEKIKQEGYLSAFYWPALIMVIFTGIAFGLGLWLVSKGTSFMTLGQLTTMLTLLIQLIALNFVIPLRLIMLQAGLVNAKRIWSIMNFQEKLITPMKNVVPNWNSALIFDKVSFKYPGKSKLVLKDISFKIPAGSKVALLGGPGSGKSTILKLLLRLYDPTSGSIYLNGVNFSDINTFEIRKNIKLVEQDIFLFGSSFKDNISFSKPEATMDDIKLAAKQAQLDKFIESTLNGYDTIVGERGVKLSGGQRQRVAIARALLVNPKLLLLDDSTSAVDIITEVKLRLALSELIKGRTSIIVTQRLSTLVDSDLIIFLDKGHIIDIGTHKQLLKRCTEYQFMLSLLPINVEGVTGKHMRKQISEGGSTT